MKKVLALVLALALVVCCFAACGGNSDDSTTKPGENNGNSGAAYDLSKEGEYSGKNTEYIIGATGPLTGDASSYGISVKQGAQLAIDEINAAGGLNGVNFKFDIKDDKAGATEAGTGYDALYESGMQVALGSVTSGSCEQFADKAAQDGLFFITPSASAASIIASSKYAFRVCFGDPDQGTLAAEELTSQYKKIGAIYDNSDTYSTGIYDAFKAEMAKLNVEFIEQSFDKDNKRDFSTQVEALKDCDVIFLPIYYTEAGLIAKTCSAKGCNAVLYGCDGLDGVKDQIDSSVKNQIKYITPFDVNSSDEKVSTFVKAYKEKYNAAPDQFAADAYDAVYVIYNAMKKAGVNNVKVDPAELGNAMIAAVTASDFSYKGVTGEMTWETSGACNKVPVIVELG